MAQNIFGLLALRDQQEQPEAAVPAQAPVVVGPPGSPEEAQHRATGWQMLVRKLQTDPLYQQTLLRFGTNLMQPVPVGQTPGGHLGASLQDTQNFFLTQQTATRKAGLEQRQEQREERRVGLEERRVGEAERTGTVSRKRDEQQIEQNERLFPKTMQKLDGEIKRMGTQQGLDEAQMAFLQQRAKLYPREVEAELRRARAAEVSAGKPTSYDLFQLIANATAKAEGISLEEAQARLGREHLGGARGGGGAAATLGVIEEHLQKANPKKEQETDQAYNQRISQKLLDFQKTSPGKGDFESYLKWAQIFGINYNTEEEAFTDFQKRIGSEKEGAPEVPRAPAAPAVPTAKKRPKELPYGGKLTRQQIFQLMKENPGVPRARIEAWARQQGYTIVEGNE